MTYSLPAEHLTPEMYGCWGEGAEELPSNWRMIADGLIGSKASNSSISLNVLVKMFTRRIEHPSELRENEQSLHQYFDVYSLSIKNEYYDTWVRQCPATALWPPDSIDHEAITYWEETRLLWERQLMPFGFRPGLYGRTLTVEMLMGLNLPTLRYHATLMGYDDAYILHLINQRKRRKGRFRETFKPIRARAIEARRNQLMKLVERFPGVYDSQLCLLRAYETCQPKRNDGVAVRPREIHPSPCEVYFRQRWWEWKTGNGVVMATEEDKAVVEHGTEACLPRNGSPTRYVPRLFWICLHKQSLVRLLRYLGYDKDEARAHLVYRNLIRRRLDTNLRNRCRRREYCNNNDTTAAAAAAAAATRGRRRAPVDDEDDDDEYEEAEEEAATPIGF